MKRGGGGGRFRVSQISRATGKKVSVERSASNRWEAMSSELRSCVNGADFVSKAVLCLMIKQFFVHDLQNE